MSHPTFDLLVTGSCERLFDSVVFARREICECVRLLFTAGGCTCRSFTRDGVAIAAFGLFGCCRLDCKGVCVRARLLLVYVGLVSFVLLALLCHPLLSVLRVVAIASELA